MSLSKIRFIVVVAAIVAAALFTFGGTLAFGQDCATTYTVGADDTLRVGWDTPPISSNIAIKWYRVDFVDSSVIPARVVSYQITQWVNEGPESVAAGILDIPVGFYRAVLYAGNDAGMSPPSDPLCLRVNEPAPPVPNKPQGFYFIVRIKK